MAADAVGERRSREVRLGEEGMRACLMRLRPVSRSAVRMGDLFVADMHVSDCTSETGACSHRMCRCWLVCRRMYPVRAAAGTQPNV